MTAIEYLGQVEKWYKRLTHDREELDALKEFAVHRPSIVDTERVQSSSVVSVADIVDRYIDIEKDVVQEEWNYLAFRNEAYERIVPVDEHFKIDILYERYFLYKRLDDIAVDNGYSYSQIYRMHKQALNMFQQKWADNLNCEKMKTNENK